MKVDVLDYLRSRNDVRIRLDDEKRNVLNSSISLKYGNVKKMCESHGFNYDSVNRWFSLSSIRRREPSFAFLGKVCGLLGCRIDDFVGGSAILVGCGNCFQELPRYIEIDDGFYEGFGLYYGDGQNKVGTNEFAFSNTNFGSLNHIMGWFEKYFRIRKEDFKVYIYRPLGMSRKEAYSKVLENLDAPESNVKGVYFNRRSRKVHVIIMIKNAAFKYAFDGMSADLAKRVKSDSLLSSLFLKGYLAAEGNVYTPSNQRICKISIGFGSASEFELLKECLRAMKIEFTTSHSMNRERTKEYPKIEIHKKDSVLRLYRISGFGPNNERQSKFGEAVKYIGG